MKLTDKIRRDWHYYAFALGLIFILNGVVGLLGFDAQGWQSYAVGLATWVVSFWLAGFAYSPPSGRRGVISPARRGRYCYRFATVLVREKRLFCAVSRAHCAPDISSALCLSWRRERTEGGQSPPPSVLPGSGRQNRHFVVPSTYPCRLRVGPRQRPCKTRPSARIHAGCPGLPGTSQRF